MNYLVGSDVIGAGDTHIGLEVPPSPVTKTLVTVGVFAGMVLAVGILMREFTRAMAER